MVTVFLGSVDPFSNFLNTGLGGTGKDPIGSINMQQNPNTYATDQGLFYSVYRIEKGDMLSSIAEDNDVSLDTLVSFNEVQNSRALPIGTLLKIPNMSGILYSAKKGDTPETIAKEYSISNDRIIEVNSLKTEELAEGKSLFLPDARLASFKLREINGDLFRWPVSGGYMTSWYGWRKDPFGGSRQFHNGLDIGSPMGTPVYAAMEGSVLTTGYSLTFGNYIILSHHSGYQTLYGHLSKIMVSGGSYVNRGQRIGSVGNTGNTTGPHLHFTVIKYGRTLNPAYLLN